MMSLDTQHAIAQCMCGFVLDALVATILLAVL